MPLDLITYGEDDSLNSKQKVSCGKLSYSGSPRRTLHLFSDTVGAKMWSGKLKTAIHQRIQAAEAHNVSGRFVLSLKLKFIRDAQIVELNLFRRFKAAPTCSAEFCECF